MSLNLNYQPEVLVSTEGLTEEEWLNYRRKGIGGCGCYYGAVTVLYQEGFVL